MKNIFHNGLNVSAQQQLTSAASNGATVILQSQGIIPHVAVDMAR
jgi:hypothetical protein